MQNKESSHTKRAFSKANKLIQVKNQNCAHTIISISFAKLITNDKNYPPWVIVATTGLSFFIFFFDFVRCVEESTQKNIRLNRTDSRNWNTRCLQCLWQMSSHHYLNLNKYIRFNHSYSLCNVYLSFQLSLIFQWLKIFLTKLTKNYISAR